MPVMDEFREEREAIKHGTPKEKFSYFIDYYKWHVVAAVAILAFLFSVLHHILTSKEAAFYGAFINSLALGSSEEHLEDFAQYAEIDMDTYDLVIDNSLHLDITTSPSQDSIATSQKLMAYLAAGEIDVFLSDEIVIRQYAYNETFYDLREILTQEQIDRYEPYFFYMDQAVVDAIEAAQADSNYDFNNRPEIPDTRNPDAMEQPIPVGIILDNADSFSKIFYFEGDGSVVIAVAVTSPHPENAVKYIDYLLTQ